MKSKFLLAILFFLVQCELNAQTIWTGSVDSLWNNPANWNPQVVPDSLSRVIIRFDPGNPQPHWPHLSQTTKAGRVLCENAEIYFAGNLMSCFSFSSINSSIFGGNDTSSILLFNNRDSLKSITLTNSQFHSDFKIWTHFRSRVDLLGITADGMLFTSGDGVEATITIKDSSVFLENLAFKYDDFHEPELIRRNQVYLHSAIIQGDLVIQSKAGGLFYNGPLLRTFPNFGVIIKGRIFTDINHPYSYLVFHRVINEGGEGNIIFNGNGPLLCVKSELRTDSISAEIFTLPLLIDSSNIYSSCRIQSHSRSPNIPNPPKESRISASTFYGNFSLTDTFELIDETRGLYHLNNPLAYVFGGPNTFHGDTYFKGKINLGLTDTSNFHGNLTIEAMDGSVYHRARFTGDQVSEVNVGSTPFQYAIIDKTGSGNVNLSSPLNVSGFMRFDNGKVQTSNGSHLKFLPGAVAENFGGHSYVNGLVQKEGNTSFVFPTGSADHFKPLSISAPADVADIISVQYQNGDVSSITDTALRVSGLTHIGNCEYWEVEQVNGNSNVSIAPSWDQSCLENTIYFTDPSSSRLARWDGSQWLDEGNGGYTNGFISSSAGIIPNGIFTFASPRRQVVIPNPEPEPPSMVIYPNPSSNSINVVVDSGYNKGMIIDAIGRTISIHTMIQGLNNINVENLPTGVYFLKLITARKQKVLKWVKI